MAKEYEEFVKSFKQIQPRIDNVAAEIKKNANLVAQTSGIIQEGVKELGLRI
jgi:hypothetical protein